jgi:predicted transcriptional regulator
MADQNPTGGDRTPPPSDSPAREDAKVEAAVLGLLLAEYPAQLTFDELSLALALGERSDFRHRDAIERAVRELEGAGLVNRSRVSLAPSRAALRFAALELA